MNKKGVFLVVLSALIYGFTPILCSITYKLGNNAMSLTFFRSFFCLPILFVFMVTKKIEFKLSLFELKNIFIVGVSGAVLTTFLLYSSYNYVDVGTATTLHFLYPVFVTLIYKFYYRENISYNQIISLLLSVIGVLFFININNLSQINGLLMALCSGITFAVYLVLMEKKKLSEMNGIKFSFYLSLTVTFMFLIINIFTKTIIYNQSAKSLGIMFIVAILASFIAVIFLKEGIRLIGSAYASIFSLFEPISSVFFGLIFLGENITINKVIGCVFIVFGIFILAMKNTKNKS